MGLVLAAPIHAETATPGKVKTEQHGAAAVPADPSLTTVVYGDWVLRCIKTAASTAASRCEVAQFIMVQGQQSPVAQIAVGRAETAGDLAVTVLLPANVTVPASPRLMSDDKDKEGMGLAWQRCVGGLLRHRSSVEGDG